MGGTIKKYKLLIEGKNLLTRIEGQKPKKYGFFTMRMIEAESKTIAESVAIDLIKNELKGLVLNKKNDPPILFVEDIQEIVASEDRFVHERGFTWYEDKKSSKFS